MPRLLKESDRALAMRRAQSMMGSRAGSPMGFGFDADDPQSLKRGLMLMQQQLKDMEAHPNRYIQAMKSGMCVAGFGGDLFGIEVPETLMYGEIPPGVTPAQAFQQVIDYMRQVIEAARNKLSGPASNRTAFKAPPKMLESIDRLIISTGSWGSVK